VQHLSGDSFWASRSSENLWVLMVWRMQCMHAKNHACKENICQPSAGDSSQLLLDGFKISSVRKCVCLFTGGGLTSTPSSSGKARCRRTAGGGKGGRSTSAAPRPSPPSPSVQEPYLRRTTRGRSRAEEQSAQGLLAHVMAHACTAVPMASVPTWTHRPSREQRDTRQNGRAVEPLCRAHFPGGDSGQQHVQDSMFQTHKPLCTSHAGLTWLCAAPAARRDGDLRCNRKATSHEDAPGSALLLHQQLGLDVLVVLGSRRDATAGPQRAVRHLPQLLLPSPAWRSHVGSAAEKCMRNRYSKCKIFLQRFCRSCFSLQLPVGLH